MQHSKCVSLLIAFLASLLLDGRTQTIESLGSFTPVDLSGDGSVVVGRMNGEGGVRIIQFKDGVAEDLGPGGASAISADGRVIVGQATVPAEPPLRTRGVAFRMEDGELTLIPLQPQASEASAGGVNADGSIVYMRGIYVEPTLTSDAFRWVNGVVSKLPGATHAGAGATNALGDRAIGFVAPFFRGEEGNAALWENGSLERIGAKDTFPGGISADGTKVIINTLFVGDAKLYDIDTKESVAIGGFGASLNRNGSIVIGRNQGALFLWTEEAGRRPLAQALEEDHDIDLEGWDLGTSGTYISDDGNVLVGSGVDPSGERRAWRLQLETGPEELTVNVTGDEEDADPDDGVVDVDLEKSGRQVTLRAAIEEANREPDMTEIFFDIEGAGTPVISPTKALPAITHETIINAGSQPGAARVRIDGSAAPAISDALRARAKTTFKSLEIINFKGGAGIRLTGAQGHTISGCFLGTDAAGNPGLGNKTGILAEEVAHTEIGAGGKNVISANEDGIRLVQTLETKILNSNIGTKLDGITPLPNTRHGIDSTKCQRLTIGGPDSVTVVIGNEAGFSAKEISDFTIEAANFGVGADGKTVAPDMKEGICLENCIAGKVTGGTASASFAGINITGGKDLLFEAMNIGATADGMTDLPVENGFIANGTENLTIGSDKGLTVVGAVNAIRLIALRGRINRLINYHLGIDRAGRNPFARTKKALFVDDCHNLKLEGKIQGRVPRSITFNAAANSLIHALCGGVEVKNSENVEAGWFMVNTDSAGMNSLRPPDPEFFAMVFEKCKGVRVGLGGAILLNGPFRMQGLRKLPGTGGNADLQNVIERVRVNLNAIGDAPLSTEPGAAICLEDSIDVVMDVLEVGQAETAIEVLKSTNVTIGSFSIGRATGGSTIGELFTKAEGIFAVTQGILAEETALLRLGRETQESLSHVFASVGSIFRKVENSSMTNVNFAPKIPIGGTLPRYPDTHLVISGCEVLSLTKLRLPGFRGSSGCNIEFSERVSIQDCEMGNLLFDLPPNRLLPLVSQHVSMRACADLIFADNRINPFNTLGAEDILLIDGSNTVNVSGNWFGVRKGEEGDPVPIKGNAVEVSGASAGVDILGNRMHQTSEAAIRVGGEAKGVTFRINEAINVAAAAERDEPILQESLGPITGALFHDGSTHITAPITGEPGNEVILDVYAFSPEAKGVEAEHHLGSHPITYGPDGSADLAAVLDGSARRDTS